MHLKAIIVGVFSLIAGILIGKWLPDAELAKNEELDVAKDIRLVNSKEDPTSADGVFNGDDPVPLQEASGFVEPEDHGPLVVVPVSFLEEIGEKHGGQSLELPLFGSDRTLEDLLQISEGEKISLQRAWRRARSRIQTSERQKLTFDDLEDGGVRITVPDMVGQFQLVGNEFQSRAREVLGVNRARAFLASKKIGAVFSPESGARVYTVSVEAVGDGRWRYRMSSTEPGGSSKMWVGESIPLAYRHLTDKAQIDPNLNPPEEVDEEG